MDSSRLFRLWLLRHNTGTVHVPASAGCFRITAPITMQQGISLVGEGGLGSCILADDTDALHLYLDDNGTTRYIPAW